MTFEEKIKKVDRLLNKEIDRDNEKYLEGKEKLTNLYYFLEAYYAIINYKVSQNCKDMAELLQEELNEEREDSGGNSSGDKTPKISLHWSGKDIQQERE